MSTEVPTEVKIPTAPTPPKITTEVKTKNPGRVAAGKRLAEISKAARERKKLETANPGSPSYKDTLFTYQNIFAIVGISIGAAALFYELYPRKPTRTQSDDERPASKHVEIKKDPPAVKRNTQLGSFD